MVVLVLLLLWAVVLAPFAWRKLADYQSTFSAGNLGYLGRLQSLRRQFGKRSDSSAEIHDTVPVPDRLARRRHHEKIVRRRRVVGGLAGTILATGTLGAIPGLHMFWVLTIITAVLACGYLGLLAYIVRGESLMEERSQKVVSLVPRSLELVHTRAVAVGAARGTHIHFEQRPLQPTFRILEAPSRR